MEAPFRSCQSFVRKCKVSSILNNNYSDLRQLLRVIAEEHTILRQDACNLAYFLTCKALEPDETDEYVLKSVTEPQFWSHMYRIVSSTPIEESRYVFYHPFVQANFASFDALRRHPVTGEHLYGIPELDNLHGVIATSYSTKMCTNVKGHLALNLHRFLKRVIKGYIEKHNKDNADNSAYIPLKMSSKILQSITTYTPFTDEEKQEEFGRSMDAIEFYNLQQAKYCEFFSPMTEEKLQDYETAAAKSGLYIRYFKSLLQDIENYSLDNVKRFSLLPIASHQIVHVSISSDAFYQLLKRAYNEKFNVPDATVVSEVSSIRPNAVSFIRKTDYTKQYKDLIWKEQLWEEIFNLDHVQRRRSRAQDTSKSTNVCFDYGFETDVHMISLRFRKSVSSSYPGALIFPTGREACTLSKEPAGLFLNDRIIGIDPGHRDLVTCVDTDSELTSKALRKAHSFSISNAQYQEQYGFKWAIQAELKSRKNAANIQAIYNLIPSPKVFCRFKFMEYINVISATRNMSMIMGGHRENKGYMYSNKRIALHNVTETIIGKLDHSIKLHSKLAHKSTKKKRSNRRKKNKIASNEGQRCVVAYGDASISASMKSRAPIPVKVIFIA
ncbi:hypothetical protein RMATCC62417_09663 [Rhizopus microsporus]|nr:hypothetical protein RMATCC62417_09663 [Rhizopus microsporus]